jgi:hypothetical protein
MKSEEVRLIKLSQGHIGQKWKSQSLNPGIQMTEPKCERRKLSSVESLDLMVTHFESQACLLHHVQ